jgi:hypothetical protein
MSAAAVTAATTASIIASQNAQRAHEKRVYDCSLYVEGFEHNQASVKQIQTYTECAELLYPKPSTPEGDQLLYKGCVMGLLIAMLVGMIFGWKENRLEGMMFNGFIFPVTLLAIVGVLVLVVAGIGFILS